MLTSKNKIENFQQFKPFLIKDILKVASRFRNVEFQRLQPYCIFYCSL